jgi:hypothetical protein
MSRTDSERSRTVNQPQRQGDVFLIPVDVIPEGTTTVARDNGRVVLAYGEVTGHSHAIAAPTATLLSTAENERFLRIVGSGATLTHEEHGAIAIAPGEYRVIVGREFTSDMAIRPVVD